MCDFVLFDDDPRTQGLEQTLKERGLQCGSDCPKTCPWRQPKILEMTRQARKHLLGLGWEGTEGRFAALQSSVVASSSSRDHTLLLDWINKKREIRRGVFNKMIDLAIAEGYLKKG